MSKLIVLAVVVAVTLAYPQFPGGPPPHMGGGGFVSDFN